MINTQSQEELFTSIGKQLKKKIEVYAIGGTAMMFRGVKDSTLDIDLVFSNNKDREMFINAACSFDFVTADALEVYGLRDNIPKMVKNDKCRIDLFIDRIISSYFSNEMRERAQLSHEFSNLIVRVASLEDVIIMKSVTSRMKDEDDVVNAIASARIDWGVVIKESKNQVDLGMETAVLNLGYLLERIQNRKEINAEIPKHVLDELWKMLKKQVDSKVKKR